MEILDILAKDCVRVPLLATDKTGAITELVDLLDKVGRLADRDAVLEAILRREQTRTTGIGDALAVPHGKSTGCTKLAMAVGRPGTPIDFGSKDGRACELIVLLASPAEEMGPHIQALARISRLWLAERFRADVADVDSADALHDVFVRHHT